MVSHIDIKFILQQKIISPEEKNIAICNAVKLMNQWYGVISKNKNLLNEF